MPKPGEWANRQLTDAWFNTCEAALTEQRLAQLCELRGFADPSRLLDAFFGLGFDVETKSWVLPLWNIYSTRYAAKLWRPSGTKWITAGWATTRQPERLGEPVGRLFDLGWIVHQLDHAQLPWEKRWLWITAGEWDCLMLRSVGWLATTSINGESSHPQPEMLLRELGGAENALAILGQIRGIVVCFDVDEAGRQGAVQFVDAFERLVNRLLESDVGAQLTRWDGVRAISLATLPGYEEAGQPEGWDVSDLLRWSRSSGTLVGSRLLGAANDAGIGLVAARQLLDVDERIDSRKDLSNVMVRSREMHLATVDEMIDLALKYGADRDNSRAQIAYHFGLVASRKGWVLDELLAEDAENRLLLLFNDIGEGGLFPGKKLMTVSEIHGHLTRSLLDVGHPEILNTDRANVYRLHHYFPFLIYHPTQGWKYWDGVAWIKGEQKVNDHAWRIADYIREEAQALRDNGDTEAAKTLGRWAKQSESHGKQTSMVSGAAKLSLFRLEDETESWDANAYMLGTPRGVFDLRTGTLLTGTEARNQFCSMNTNGSILLDSAGPDRWGDSWSRCWQFWEGILGEWHPDGAGAEVVRMLQEIAGMCLRGQNDELWIVLQGSGRSGKSAFMDAMKYALGEYAQEISGDVLTKASRFGGGASGNAKTAAMVQLDHKRMVKITEAGERQLDTNMIKTLTGESELVGRALYSGWSSVTNTGTYWMMTNHELDLRGDISEALRGRLWIVPWLTTFVHESRISLDEYRSGVEDGSVRRMRDDVKPRLMGQESGFEAMPDVVITWAYMGLLRVMSKGLAPAARVAEMTDVMWQNSDVLSEYFNGSGFWVSGGETIVASEGFYNNWRSWALVNNAEAAEQYDKQIKFSSLLKTMSARGITSTRASNPLWAKGQANCWRVPWTWMGPKGGGNVG